MGKRVFISKNASEIEPFRSQFEELGLTVVPHSFLSFYPVEFEIQREFDVLFFSSVRSVIFFKAAESIEKNTLVACVGSKTAELLEALGHSVDFVGTKSGAPKVVAEEFKTWLASTPLRQAQRSALSPRVFFPISDRSLKSISSEIPDNQKEEAVVYTTKISAKAVEKCDVYVFTSPSNVDGFFIDNLIPEGSKVIAWGKSTEAALISRTASVDYCLKNSSFEELNSYLGSI